MALFGGITIPRQPDPENIRKLDLLQMPMIMQMMRYGMRIDKDHFAALSSFFRCKMAELKRDITDAIPPESLDRLLDLVGDDDPDTPDPDVTTEIIRPEFNVESNQKVCELLYSVLNLQNTDGVKVKKTKSGKISAGKKTLEQFKRENPIVDMILQYREFSKLDGTYAQSMPRGALLHPKGADCPRCGRHHYSDEWRVHPRISTTRTTTGRTATSDKNLANIPARTKYGRMVREGFIASDGHVLSQRDFSQIELRLMADQSGDEIMLAVYAADGDIHMETAMRTFDISDPALVDKLAHRAPAKNVNFAVVYLISGMGLLDLMAASFAVANKPLPSYMTEVWCDEFIAKWFQVYKRVRRYLDREEAKVRRYGFVWTQLGRVRLVPETRSYHAYIQSAGVRQACNMGIQGYSADIMKLAMGELHSELEHAKEYGIQSYPLMSIYDELLVETPEDFADGVQVIMGEVMDNVLEDRQTGVLHCKVPIKSEGHLMKKWVKD